MLAIIKNMRNDRKKLIAFYSLGLEPKTIAFQSLTTKSIQSRQPSFKRFII